MPEWILKSRILVIFVKIPDQAAFYMIFVSHLFLQGEF